jgi:epidermal growth factor receptor substrate 15
MAVPLMGTNRVVFAGLKLPLGTLGGIWALADPENNDSLTRRGVAITVRLIGWAQAGNLPAPELCDKREHTHNISHIYHANSLISAGPTPVIEGIAAPAHAGQTTPIAMQSSALPPLLPTDRMEFLNVYQNANPLNGFVTSKLTISYTYPPCVLIVEQAILQEIYSLNTSCL